MAAAAMSFACAAGPASAAVAVGARNAGGGASSRCRLMAVKVASPKAAVRMAVMASSATGAPGRSATDSALGDCWTRGGVAKARRAQRGKVITEAETSSFPGDSPSASNKRPYGFWKTFWGKDHNEAKDFAPIVWRVLSCLPYLIPCMGAIAFTDQAFMTFPMTFNFAILMSPLLQVFYSNSFIPFVTFFTLFLAVVRNVKLNHFLRYNTMQAILLDICVMLAGLIMQYLPMYITTSAIGSLLECFILINALFAIFYCQWNVVQGIYPEIPIITEAVYAQVRDV